MKNFFKNDFRLSKKKCAVLILFMFVISVPLAYLSHHYNLYSRTYNKLYYKLYPNLKSDSDGDYAYTTLPQKPHILVNIHVGKTGGSTMNEIIIKHFSDQDHVNINCTKQPEERYSYGSIRKPIEDFYTVANVQFIPHVTTGGHVGLEVLNFIPQNENAKAFAIIREPKSLMISNFWYAVQTVNPFKEWFGKLDISNLDERLFKFISTGGSGSPYKPYNNLSIRWFSRNNKVYDHKVPITEEIFQEIKNNIKNDFLLIGLTHRFEETLIAFRRLMGWKFDEQLFYKQKNKTEFKMPESSYPDSILELESERVNFEIRLYKWLEKRFDSLIKLLGSDFDEEVRMFKRLNYLYQIDSPDFSDQLKLIQKKYAWANPTLIENK